MKTPPEKTVKPSPASQKKQVLFLGGLLALLVAVLVVQFGSGEEDAPIEVAMLAETAAAEPGEAADVAALGESVPSVVVRDNPVLSRPLSEEEQTLARSPFTSLWATSGGNQGRNADAQPPTVVLNLTLPSTMAVIDGRLRFVGDDVQGWELAEVRPRAVVLRAPSNALAVVEMPLLRGVIDIPVTAGR